MDFCSGVNRVLHRTGGALSSSRGSRGASVPSWITKGATLVYISKSRGDAHHVVVERIENIRESVVVRFEKDRSVWKRIPFNECSSFGDGTLRPIRKQTVQSAPEKPSNFQEVNTDDEREPTPVMACPVDVAKEGPDLPQQSPERSSGEVEALAELSDKLKSHETTFAKLCVLLRNADADKQKHAFTELAQVEGTVQKLQGEIDSCQVSDDTARQKRRDLITRCNKLLDELDDELKEARKRSHKGEPEKDVVEKDKEREDKEGKEENKGPSTVDGNAREKMPEGEASLRSSVKKDAEGDTQQNGQITEQQDEVEISLNSPVQDEMQRDEQKIEQQHEDEVSLRSPVKQIAEEEPRRGDDNKEVLVTTGQVDSEQQPDGDTFLSSPVAQPDPEPEASPDRNELAAKELNKTRERDTDAGDRKSRRGKEKRKTQALTPKKKKNSKRMDSVEALKCTADDSKARAESATIATDPYLETSTCVDPYLEAATSPPEKLKLAAASDGLPSEPLPEAVRPHRAHASTAEVELSADDSEASERHELLRQRLGVLRQRLKQVWPGQQAQATSGGDRDRRRRNAEETDREPDPDPTRQQTASKRSKHRLERQASATGAEPPSKRQDSAPVPIPGSSRKRHNNAIDQLPLATAPGAASKQQQSAQPQKRRHSQTEESPPVTDVGPARKRQKNQLEQTPLAGTVFERDARSAVRMRNQGGASSATTRVTSEDPRVRQAGEVENTLRTRCKAAARKPPAPTKAAPPPPEVFGTKRPAASAVVVLTDDEDDSAKKSRPQASRGDRAIENEKKFQAAREAAAMATVRTTNSVGDQEESDSSGASEVEDGQHAQQIQRRSRRHASDEQSGLSPDQLGGVRRRKIRRVRVYRQKIPTEATPLPESPVRRVRMESSRMPHRPRGNPEGARYVTQR